MRIAATAMASTAIAAALLSSAPASADPFTLCPSGISGVTTADTSCAFADNVSRAWYSQPGMAVLAYSPVTGQLYTMTCVSTYTDWWPEAKRCIGANTHGVALIVYID